MDKKQTLTSDPRSNKQARRQLKKQRQEKDRRQKQQKRAFKKVATIVLTALAASGAIFWLYRFIANQPKLPPITAQGHTEDMPQTHVINSPIPDSTQRHMLEHADGRGKPGIIIQYNCEKYSCEPDLIAKLDELVKQYPDNVYLAPNRYDGKIILTKINQRQILTAFDKAAIESFLD